jgi:hypothetical protein
MFCISSDGIEAAVIEAAKARLASAERWAETTSKSLKSAQDVLMSAQNALTNAETEHESAKKEADEARAYLASIDSSSESNDAHNPDRQRSTGQIPNNRSSSGNTVGFDEDTSTITFDGGRSSRFVKDDDDGSSSKDYDSEYDSSSLVSSEKVILKTSSKDVVLKMKSFPVM